MAPSVNGSGTTKALPEPQLPPDFEPTPEEKSLLDLFAKVKDSERQAAKIREKAAKAKLDAANKTFREKQERENAPREDLPPGGGGSNKRSRKHKKKKTKPSAASSSSEFGVFGGGSDSQDSDSSSEGNSDDNSDSDDDVDDEEKRRIAKESEEDAAEKAAAEEERLREEMMMEGTGAEEMGPLLMKKRRKMHGSATGLIASVEAASTPPHEFSKSLNMTRISLKGRIVYPQRNDPGDIEGWTPPEYAMSPNEGALIVDLPDFESYMAQRGKGNNTIAIKFHAPQESRRFSLNIVGPGHQDFYDVLFHFNPRQRHRGGQLVVNDKQEGIWGQGVNVNLNQCPQFFGRISQTLIIQITGEGFDVFMGERHCCRLEHRTQLPPARCKLQLQFPSTDDYGSPENWTVYKVWWGHKEVMSGNDARGAAGVKASPALHPKKIFVSGLSKISSESEVDARRSELERDFRKYGGVIGPTVTVPTNATFAFVEVESERQADLAMTEMVSSYRMSRARLTRHEVQQQNKGQHVVASKKRADSSEWD
eukprot:CAMPEP_0195523952 /NCGR_PEP_ID=MMETSP0794_2-20130614/23481_1 /TAXON_ID=515487 /ORGANISM="Stephanopyxis turris, Strain CCMP 815" /LENGTH=536 /DNA_ID=CAMNT_0040654063 /DNA_START=25 /DNA_END=1635 /DNA_ORIENTATION=+